ncbi:hypothetical protein DIPPA_06113 [Diplonema papillatum]|nr:hypothetical protein DIPPA_06113 [Diplonema papillatum]
MFVSIGTTACLEYREGSALGNLLRQRSELERRLWEAEADQYVTNSASEVREAVELLGPPEVEACIMESEHELFAGLGP